MIQLTDHEQDALAALCNCARSRGRHSSHCPSVTAAPRIRAALDVATHRLLDRISRAEAERDEAAALALAPSAGPDFDPSECGNCGRCGHCDPPQLRGASNV